MIGISYLEMTKKAVIAMILKKEEIEAFLKRHDLFEEDTHFVWATVRGAYFIVAMDASKLMLLPITPMGKISGEIHLLEQKDIEKIEIKKSSLDIN